MLVFSIALLIVIATLAFVSVVLCLGKYNAWRIYRKGISMLFYNTIIRFYLSSMLKLMVGSATSLTLLKVSEPSGILSTLILVVITASPVAFAITIYSLRERLYLPSMRGKIGSMFGGIKSHASNLWQLSYSTLFLFRRQFFVMVMFSMPLAPEI